MDKPSWAIYYSRFSGIERRAVELLQREIGRQTIRERGRYILHVLPCLRCVGSEKIEANGVVVGLWDESPLVRRWVGREEIPSGGYVVKVVSNPDNASGVVVLITAHEESMLYAGAVAFLDDYAVRHMTAHGGMRYPDKIFDFPLVPDVLSSCPAAPVRSIFAWGHAINDYRSYLQNMARLKLNRLILWNDFVPLNMRDIIEYAHSFGIQVFSGFAWGWIDGCSKITSIDDGVIRHIRDQVLEIYEREHAPIGFDGIYFQSFTERGDDRIGGRLIAACVADLVNETGGELLRRYPHLSIEFGLHAMSVRNHLEEIARVDPRIEILWEDCGAFPYRYIPAVPGEEEFTETLSFTERILGLRPGAPVGLVFKGMATLDWCNGLFRYQCGPYILGENDPEISAHDWELREDSWRVFSAEWCESGQYAQRLARHALSLSGGQVHLCMAGLYDGPITLPQALCAEIFWDPAGEFSVLRERVMKRPMLRQR